MIALRRIIRVIIRARPFVVPLFKGYGEGRSLISSMSLIDMYLGTVLQVGAYGRKSRWCSTNQKLAVKKPCCEYISRATAGSLLTTPVGSRRMRQYAVHYSTSDPCLNAVQRMEGKYSR
jgi:hypothetical protein